MRKDILFVEDDDIIRENYAELLTDEGFQVYAVPDRHSALDLVRRKMPALALLDISLGLERDGGFLLCAELRRLSAKLPIVFLTSHDEEINMISGMRLGADDYIIKDPDKLNFLVVRLEAMLRRVQILSHPDSSNPAPESHFLSRGPLNIRCDLQIAYWKDVRVDLTLTQLWLLEDLVLHPGHARSTEQLMAAAKITVEPNTIAAHIKTIRSRFKMLDSKFDSIRTERGKGYRWIDPIC